MENNSEVTTAGYWGYHLDHALVGLWEFWMVLMLAYPLDYCLDSMKDVVMVAMKVEYLDCLLDECWAN